MNRAAKLYLSLLITENYPDQEPAYKVAKNHDLFWMLIPILGFLLFIGAVEDRYERQQSNLMATKVI